MKILLIAVFSLFSVFGFALQASEAEARRGGCHYRDSSYHCHKKHGQRYCHRLPVAWHVPKKVRKAPKIPVYFVAAPAPTPQCYWSYGYRYCAW